MRVAMVAPFYDKILGGGEISCRLLVEGLRGKGVEVDVFSDMSVRDMRSKLLHHRWDYDLFHGYNMAFLPLLGWLSKKYGVSTVGTLNGITLSRVMSGRNRVMTFWKRFPLRFVRNISGFTTLCPFYRDSWVRDGLDEDKIWVIPNMVDPDFRFFPHVDSDVFRCLFVGSRAWWRDLELFNSISKGNGFSSRVVGSGWGESVSYEDMGRVYACSDVLVLPYHMPVPVSRCILEAMMCGVPVVTRGVDCLSPVIRNGVDGFLVDGGDVGRWHSLVCRLRRDRGLYNRIAISAHRRVWELCNPDRIVDLYLGVYNNVLECVKYEEDVCM